jgi:hypothetical protein
MEGGRGTARAAPPAGAPASDNQANQEHRSTSPLAPEQFPDMPARAARPAAKGKVASRWDNVKETAQVRAHFQAEVTAVATAASKLELISFPLPRECDPPEGQWTRKHIMAYRDLFPARLRAAIDVHIVSGLVNLLVKDPSVVAEVREFVERNPLLTPVQPRARRDGVVVTLVGLTIMMWNPDYAAAVLSVMPKGTSILDLPTHSLEYARVLVPYEANVGDLPEEMRVAVGGNELVFQPTFTGRPVCFKCLCRGHEVRGCPEAKAQAEVEKKRAEHAAKYGGATRQRQRWLPARGPRVMDGQKRVRAPEGSGAHVAEAIKAHAGTTIPIDNRYLALHQFLEAEAPDEADVPAARAATPSPPAHAAPRAARPKSPATTKRPRSEERSPSPVFQQRPEKNPAEAVRVRPQPPQAGLRMAPDQGRGETEAAAGAVGMQVSESEFVTWTLPDEMASSVLMEDEPDGRGSARYGKMAGEHVTRPPGASGVDDGPARPA